MVTLRGDRMYEFFDRLVNVALARVRDFRSVSRQELRRRGNYTLGVKDQLIFPEIDYSKVEKTKGMNISITTTARTDAEGLALLRQMECRSGIGRWQVGIEEHGDYRKDRARYQAREIPPGQDARAAMQAPQPLLALRASARLPA